MIQLNPLALCRADLPAPALSRGVGILLYLAQKEAATLEQIANDLEIPKASAFRLLQTLEACNTLHKTPQRTYELLLSLQPATDPLTIFRKQLESRLASLCQQTDCTAEWYEPSKEGMVLTLQKQPDTELCVQARPAKRNPRRGGTALSDQSEQFTDVLLHYQRDRNSSVIVSGFVTF